MDTSSTTQGFLHPEVPCLGAVTWLWVKWAGCVRPKHWKPRKLFETHYLDHMESRWLATPISLGFITIMAPY